MKENNTTPSKKRRLIASMVAGAFLSGAIAFGAGFVCNISNAIKIKSEINDLQDELQQISIAIQASDEFQQEFTTKYQQYTDAYNNNLLTKEEYYNKINNLNSFDAIKEYAIRTANTDTASTEKDFVEVDNKISSKQDENVNQIFPSICTMAGFVGSLGVGIYSIQDIIDSKHDAKKEENNLQK